tara:strand:+ start:723 stop:1553 length:831 start_codon:yes stop_codon:yes gene_type:complete
MSNIYLGDETWLANPQFGSDCFNEFVTELAEEVTGSCMIPMNLPKKEVQNIVKRSKKWFYKNYEYSVKESFVVLPVSLFSSEYFKANRSITLPGPSTSTGGNEIFSVYGVFETGSRWGGSSDINFSQGDFSTERMMMQGMYGGATTAAGAENLQSFVINESFYDLARQIIDNPISFNYTQSTHELKFTGGTPQKDVILEVYETIPECALFSDEAFFRYCAAKIKISLGQKLGIFGFTLPGNIQVNADLIQGLGESELEAVIEEIKSDEGTDWMMHS